MPSSDLILNVKQIAGYPQAGVQSSDAVLLQRGGLGGPYMSLDTATYVSNALVDGSEPLKLMPLPSDASGNQISTFSIASQVGAIWYWNGYFSSSTGHGVRLGSGISAALEVNGGTGFNFYFAPPGSAGDQLQNLWQTAASISPTGYLTVADQVLLARDPVDSMEAATASWVSGHVMAAVAPLWGNYKCATVWSVNGRTGQVILGATDIMAAGGAPIWSPAFQGIPTAPFPSTNDNSNQIATTQWVWTAIQASIQGDSPNFTGTPTAPTAPADTDTTQIATTAFVQQEIANSTLWAPLASPAFTGLPTAPTPPAGASDGRLATTAFVKNAVTAATSGVASFNTRTGAVTLVATDITSAGGALLAGPAFTGVPTAPTAPPGNSSTQLATTAFVGAAIAGSTSGVTSFNARTGAVVLQATDVSGVGGALLGSPAFTGLPTAPTAVAATSTAQIATTAFVQSAIAAGAVASFNGRVGAVSLAANDLSAAGGALLASPAFTGVPTAPTAASNTNTTQLATTAFVQSVIAAGTGVSSFNARTGAVTLALADVTQVGGAPLASPALTGSPTAPTPVQGNSSTLVATTAFVANAISTGAVASFNGRQGAITLLAADLSAAGGALLAGPAFTGTPTAPTATAGTNTQQLATTAFVATALSSAGGVTSFNSRAGTVTLTSADVIGVGGGPGSFSGFVNRFRNGTMDINNRGTPIAYVSGTAGAYTLDGWVVNALGGSGTLTIRQPPAVAGGSTLYGLGITGVAAVTACNVYQNIESFVAAPLANKRVTVQFRFTNNTAAAITPQLATFIPTAQDAFGTLTADLPNTNLQPVAAGATAVVAYTFNAGNCLNGYQVILRLGALTSTVTNAVIIGEADIRVTPGWTVGLCAAPPQPELRPVNVELAFCERYYYASNRANILVAITGGGQNGWVPSNFFFPVDMRVQPTVTIAFGGTGTSGWGLTAQLVSNGGFQVWGASGSPTTGVVSSYNFTASAEL